MHWWKWSAFFPGLHSTNSPSKFSAGSRPKTFLHFFPVANGISAPYPIQVQIEVFSGGRVLSEQSFEGLRLNQPDGLDLADIFPEFFSYEANYERMGALQSTDPEAPTSEVSDLGLNILLGTNQARVDLGHSRIMVEFAYPSHRVRYHAASMNDAAREDEPQLAVFADETFKTRLLQINSNGDGPTLTDSGPIEDELAVDNSAIQFLVQYESTTTLPVSVRAL